MTVTPAIECSGRMLVMVDTRTACNICLFSLQSMEAIWENETRNNYY